MIRALMVLALLATPAMAEVGDLLIDDGDTNPEEQTLKYFTDKYDYWASKSGNHDAAKKIFDKCAAAGVAAAYPWQSYISQNGYGVPQSLEAAAEWDRKSAAMGYKVGQFNYGLNLLRGFGVPKDEAAGRAMMNASAAQGFEAAQDVIDSGYDPEVAIPDADEKRIY